MAEEAKSFVSESTPLFKRGSEPQEIVGCYIPRRYIVGFLLFLGLTACYLLRYVLLQIIFEMPLIDDFRVVISIAIVTIAQEEGWSSELKGTVLSSFYWGYICMNVPGGYLSRRFGFKVHPFYHSLPTSPLIEHIRLSFALESSSPLHSPSGSPSS